ncbi:hypothetical protein ACWF94_27255, partial [Streptomyces sp. NPDC055078]
MSPATPVPQSGGPTLELLVHGVGGASPQDMLGDPRTVRVSGDEKAAMFRRTDDKKAENHPERYRDEPIPEAYCWSNLTSGNSARALWLLLLPFMVVNLAHWMRPRARGRTRTTRTYGVLVRLVALSLTVLLTAAACEVALDLVAWQCAGSDACAEERSWLGFLSSAQGGWWAQPGRRLALASLVPAALVALLWYLSNRTWSAYESQRPPTGEDVADGARGPAAPEDTRGAEGPAGTSGTSRAADGARTGTARTARTAGPAADTVRTGNFRAAPGEAAAPDAGRDGLPPDPPGRDTQGPNTIAPDAFAPNTIATDALALDALPPDALDSDEHDGDPDGDETQETLVRPAIGRPGFWYGRRLVARLRAAHTAAGFLTVAAAVTGAAARHDRDGDNTLLTIGGWALESALVAGLIAVVWVVLRRGRSERRFDARLDRAAVRLLPGCAVAVFALSLLYASWSRPGWVSGGALPGEVTFRIIALAQGALVVALAVVAFALQRHARHPRTALSGLAGPAVAMLACALGAVMAGGIAQRVADWLDGPGTPGMDGDGTIPGPPVLLSWQASVIPVLLAVLLVPAVFLAVRSWRRARRMAGGIETEYATAERNPARPDDRPWRPDPVRTRRIAGTRARAALTDSAPSIVGIVAGATLLLGTGAVAGAWVSGEVPGKAFAGGGGFAESAAETAQSLGSWLVGFGFILFVTWGRRAYRDASARRTIGILWDVGTFWPRAAHPFAPPCYAERAVPDLTWRICTWTDETDRAGGRLVISGHSQGSVLAAAAVWQLPAETRGRVALLTYGSPLERLYGRWFPAYFGPAALRGLRTQVSCWRNLWRPTDPIGGPVLVGPDGRHPPVDGEPLRDPVVYGRSRQHP